MPRAPFQNYTTPYDPMRMRNMSAGISSAMQNMQNRAMQQRDQRMAQQQTQPPPASPPMGGSPQGAMGMPAAPPPMGGPQMGGGEPLFDINKSIAAGGPEVAASAAQPIALPDWSKAMTASGGGK